jgi:PAS domain S-box-containing protein
VRRITSDRAGRFFIGTENGGLDILDTSTGVFTHNLPDIDEPRSLNSTSIYGLTYDDQGILWIGTFNGGVNILSPPGQRFEAIRARRGGLNNPHVSAVLEDHAGNLWIGTDGGGLNRRDAKSGVWTYYTHDEKDPGSLRSNAILALAEDQDNTLWVGGWDNGLAYYDPHTDKFVTYRNKAGDPHAIPGDNIFTIRVLSTGELLVGTFSGPFLFDRKTRTASLVPTRKRNDGSYDTNPCFAVLEGPDGRLWIGTQDRADVWDRRTGQITHFSHDPANPRSMGGGVPLALRADSHGNVWIGTGADLCVLPSDGKELRCFLTSDGLPNQIANGILEDDLGNIWISTGRGIARFNGGVGLPATPSFLSFDTRDGLPASEFRLGTAFKSRRGEMFFGGQGGVAAFFPNTFEVNRTPPPVVFTELKLFNKPQAIGAPKSPLKRALFDTPGITLAHDQSMVTIEYAALNYQMPQKNLYQYRLDPVDTDWNMVGTQRAATYPVLAPGEYTFRVRAANNDGVLNVKGATLRIVVTPPWYQTTWARLAALLLVGAGLAYTYRRRVRSMEERRRELETEVERRTADLQKEITEHQRTEANLQAQIAERERAEAEAREFAEQLERNHESLLESRDALHRENEDRRRAEEQALFERDLLHALMDNIPDLIYFKDRQGRFTRINKAHAAVLGISDPHLAEGRMDGDFLPAEFAQASLQDERQIFTTGRPLVGKVEHEMRSHRWLLATKVPIRSTTGEITGVVGISKDITERKLAEEQVASQLAAFREMVDAVAKGDLTRRGSENEETVGQIARAVNQMLEAFSTILSEVREAAFSVSASSSQILATSTKIATGAQLGRDQVNETVTSVEEMAASMAQVSASAESSAAQAKQVLEHVKAGDRAVDAAYQGMTKINAAAMETAAKMKSLEQRSREVFDIIELIEEISSQSKLLSLNAAIEAAHAGDLGRGFAVVAEEVRRLAEMSTEATKQVSSRIEAIVEETQAALAATQKATREVKDGWALSEQARKSLEEISKLVKDSADVSIEIANSSREQTRATEHVAHAMEMITNFTTESVSGATETSRAVQDLVDLSNQLSEMMRRFRID